MQSSHPFDSQQALDVDFSVPYRHRLRFTSNCFEQDWKVVTDLMAATDSRARAQIWIDEGLTVSDKMFAQKIAQRFYESRDAIELTSDLHLLPGGEGVKNDESYIHRILSQIDEDHLDRRSYVIVVGGGAILDAVGFAAALAHRGIRLIRIPSTTLAQADSGVGVKTAINAFGKKNWKGSFAVPWAVINDQALLSTLSDRDFRSGFSEAVKVSLLKNPDAFRQLMANAERIAERHMPLSIQAIQASVLMHLHHITHGGDPFEVQEARPLDFGHWSAHKLESLSQYAIRHGEAVAIGVALDATYSMRTLGLPTEVWRETLMTLKKLQLPIFHPLLKSPAIFDGLEEFREHLGGRLTLTMLRDLGNPVEVHEVDSSKMLDAIEQLSLQA